MEMTSIPPNATIDNVWSYEYTAHFRCGKNICQTFVRMYGSTFALQALTYGLLCMICFGALIVLSKRARRAHLHRKFLFVLLGMVSLIRFAYSVFIVSKLMNVKNVRDAKGLNGIFIYSVMPVNALADVLLASVDLLLCFFWLRLDVAIQRFPWKVFLVTLLGMFILTGCLVGDDVHQLYIGEADEETFFRKSFYVVSSLLIASALIHIGVLGRVGWRRLEFIRASKQITWIFAIALTAMITLLCRSSVMFARAMHIWLFYKGSLSMNNAAFSAVYFVGLMNISSLLIACAFFKLTLDLYGQQIGITTQLLPGHSSIERTHIAEPSSPFLSR